MSVCRVMRATSKRLCFIASMARSNRTLSGCLEPTFASGLLTFLLVQPTLSASAPSRTIVGKLRDIRTSEPDGGGSRLLFVPTCGAPYYETHDTQTRSH